MRFSLVYLWLFIAAATIHFFSTGTEAGFNVEGFVGEKISDFGEFLNNLKEEEGITDLGKTLAQSDQQDDPLCDGAYKLVNWYQQHLMNPDPRVPSRSYQIALQYINKYCIN
ncbi:unnamed protein product [Amaranthus hypochondriacus]